MSGLVLALEWRIALAEKRLFLLHTLLPLSITLPIATGAAPADQAGSAYVSIFLGLAVLAASIPLLRDSERGMTWRIVRGGVHAGGYLVERAGASATLAFVQLVPSVVVVAIVHHASSAETMVAFVALAPALWIAALLGALAGAAGKSPLEAGLFSIVGAMLLLHMSGVFRTPAAGTQGAFLESISPFRMVHEAFFALTGAGSSVRGPGAAAAWSVAMPLITAALGPKLPGCRDRLGRVGPKRG